MKPLLIGLMAVLALNLGSLHAQARNEVPATSRCNQIALKAYREVKKWCVRADSTLTQHDSAVCEGMRLAYLARIEYAGQSADICAAKFSGENEFIQQGCIDGARYWLKTFYNDYDDVNQRCAEDRTGHQISQSTR